MTDKTLDALFLDTLKDVYYAERKILKALPKMARGATDQRLKTAFEKHKDETEVHVERLENIFDMIGKRARAKTCPAMDGIIEESEDVMDSFKGEPALDAGILAAAQTVEHYEVSRYGTLKAWAQQLGLTDAVALLDATLREEAAMDETLSGIAETAINSAVRKAA